MFGTVHKLMEQSSRDQKLVWLQGGKGFVYTEDQPACTIYRETLSGQLYQACPARNGTMTIVKDNAKLVVPDKLPPPLHYH